MRIIHLTDKGFPVSADDGGASAFVANLASAQRLDGHQVWVATTDRASKGGEVLVLDQRYSLLKQLLGLVREKSTDIVHFHGYDEDLLPALNEMGVPSVCHMHGANPGKNKRKNCIYVSSAHAANHGATAYVHNGIDVGSMPFVESPREYLAFLGKVRRSKKGADIAIAVAKKMRQPLSVVGGRKFSIPETWLPLSRYIKTCGVLAGEEKLNELSLARALLFPIRWEEPFGLVLIEAMACGVPVIAFNRGAVPEIVKDGETGFVVDDFDQMCAAVKRIDQIDRAACRQHVIDHFSIEQTVQGVEHYYKKAIAGETW